MLSLNNNNIKMKTTLKLLKVFIIILIISLILRAFAKLYAIIHYALDSSTRITIEGEVFPGTWSNLSIMIYLIIGSLFIFFLAYLAFIFRKVIISFSENSYFSSENAMQLTKVGKGLIIYGFGLFILSFILNVYLIDFTPYNSGRVFGMGVAKAIPIFIFSSFVLLIASIIKKGNILQNENELTI